MKEVLDELGWLHSAQMLRVLMLVLTIKIVAVVVAGVVVVLMIHKIAFVICRYIGRVVLVVGWSALIVGCVGATIVIVSDC